RETNGNEYMSTNSHAERMKRLGKRFSTTILVLLCLIIVLYIAFQLYTEFIWMDTLDFGNVYTTILYSKVLLGVSAFILFFLLAFLTLYWIWLSYMNHFSQVQLPD